MASESDVLSPFNGSFKLQSDLIGHQRGARSICSIDEDHLKSLVGSELVIETALSDGFEYMVTGGVDGDILVWKLSPQGSVLLLHQFMGHVNTVMAVCPSRLLNDVGSFNLEDAMDTGDVSIVDATLCVYTCGRDHLIHRFTLLGEKLLTLGGHTDTVCSLVEIDNGMRLISGSWDGTAIIWNVMSGTAQYNLAAEGHKYAVYVNFLNDKGVVAGMQTGDVCLWKEATLVEKRKIHEDAVRAISITDDTILTCSNDCSVHVFDGAFVEKYAVFHDAFIYDVRHSKLYDVFYTCSEDKNVGVWDLETGQLLQLIAFTCSVWQMAETKHHGIAIVPLNGNVTLWSLEPGKAVLPQRTTRTVFANTNKRRATSRILDMTLYKRINSEKVLQLLKSYNEQQNEKFKLTPKEYINLETCISDVSKFVLGSGDVIWVFKMLEWPLSTRLPVFDLLKSMVLHPGSEMLFKGRNGGTILSAACSTITSAEGGVPLIAITLQFFANLLHLSLSRSLMLKQYNWVLDSALTVVANEAQLVQQAFASVCQNFSIALMTTEGDKAKDASLKVVTSCCASLTTCVGLFSKIEDPWPKNVSIRLLKSLEMLMSQFPACASNLILSKEALESLDGIRDSLSPDYKRTIDAILTPLLAAEDGN